MQQTMYLHIHQHRFKTRFFNGMQTTVDHVFFGGIHLEGRRAAAGEAFSVTLTKSRLSSSTGMEIDARRLDRQQIPARAAQDRYLFVILC